MSHKGLKGLHISFCVIAATLASPTVHASHNQKALYDSLLKMKAEDFKFEHDAASKNVKFGINISRLNSIIATVPEQKVYHKGSKHMWMSKFSVGLQGNKIAVSSKLKVKYKPNKFFQETKDGKQRTSFDLSVQDGHILIDNFRLDHFDIKNIGGWVDKLVKSEVNKSLGGKYGKVPIQNIKLPAGKTMSFKGISSSGNFVVFSFSYN